jgi:hypothetical protein
VVVSGLALGLLLGTTIVVANWEALRAIHRGSVGSAAWRFGIIAVVVIGGYVMASGEVWLGAVAAVAAAVGYWSVVARNRARRHRAARSTAHPRRP